MNVRLIFISGLCFLLFQCKPNKNLKVNKAFYYWKSNDESFEPYHLDKLKKLNVKKLYIKLFEVDYSETMGNYPYEKISVDDQDKIIDDSIEIIPTIFIKNGIFQFNDKKSLDHLADNICFLVNKRMNENNSNGESSSTLTFSEIQIDCDWTRTTKDKYFYLLSKIKEKSRKLLSCTLRLYPYKFQDSTGVPPVDRVMLMCYNLIKPFSNKDINSILDLDELKKYVNNSKQYPIHLDIALPVYSWTQWYPNDHFQQLLDITYADFLDVSKPIRPMWYEITKDKNINWDIHLRVGDQIKYEDVKSQLLINAISILKSNLNLDKTVTISLFDLDDTTFKLYTDEEIGSFYSSFSK